MAYLHRLIALLFFAACSLSAVADGAPFPPRDGGYDTTYCNPTQFPQAGAGMGGIPATWTCTPQGTGQRCGWTDDSTGYFVGQCSTTKKPAACPANSVASGDMCVCSAGFEPAGGECQTVNLDRGACASFGAVQTLPGGSLVQDYRLPGSVADGAVFCMPGAFPGSPNKGCKVTFSRDAYLDYGGDKSVTEGTFSMAPDANTVDQSCNIGDPNDPPKPPEKEKCKSGYTGTVNGVEVCVNKVPDNGVGGDKTETETKNGDNTVKEVKDTKTECKNGVCTTTTTTTTTTTNTTTNTTTTNTTTNTTTEGKGSFCEQNKGSKLCSDGDDKGSSFGGTCAAGFKCEGDAIQCAIAQEQHRRACKLFDDQTPESQLYDAEKTKTGKRTDDLPGNETIEFGSSMYNSSNALGAGTCISDLPVEVLGQTVSLPISQICPHLATLRLALLAFGALLWVLIVFRG